VIIADVLMHTAVHPVANYSIFFLLCVGKGCGLFEVTGVYLFGGNNNVAEIFSENNLNYYTRNRNFLL
jgi:hypothetical protein